MPLDETGYRALRATDLLAQMQADFLDEVETRTGSRPVIDWERDTFLGPTFAVIASGLGSVSSATQAIYDARSPNNAIGTPLADLAQVGGVNKRSATFSVLSATITGDEGTTVLEGAFRFRAGGVDWEIVDTVEVGSGGTVESTFRALESGPSTVDLGSDTDDGLEILTPQIGVSNVTTGEVVAGRNVETDPELALRRTQSLQIRGSRMAAAIRARILEALDAVEACLVLEQDQPWATVLEGVSLDPHSVAVIIHPELTDDDADTLAALLYEHVASGTKMMGSVTRTIDGEGLAERTAAWDYATSIDATVTIQLRMESTTPGQPEPPDFADVEAVIAAAVEAYAEALPMGADLRKLPISAVVDATDGVRSVVAITLASDPADASRVDADGNLSIYAAEVVGTVAVSVTEAP